MKIVSRSAIERRPKSGMSDGRPGNDIEAVSTEGGVMTDGWKIQCTRQIGEHLIAAKLGRMGYAASPFAGNVPVFDLLEADKGGHVVPIQVKAINVGDWQFSASTYLKIEVGETEQNVVGTHDLLNPNVVCIFVVVHTDIPDETYILFLSDLQNLILARYEPRKLPKNIKSFHCALRQKDLLGFKEKWSVLTDAFAMVRNASRHSTKT